MLISGFILLSIYGIARVKCDFLHESSAVILTAESGMKKSFGFSLGYQNGNGLSKLIVGAPEEDLEGKVYSCNLNDLRKKCTLVDINIQTLAQYDPDAIPGQKFYLGAAIATTADYFMTCAPLWTRTVDALPDVYGTCFINNGTTYTFSGFPPEKIGWHARGIGWTLVSDEQTGFMLIFKPSSINTIGYLDINKPFDYVRPAIQPKLQPHKLYFGNLLNTGYGMVAGKFFSKTEVVYAFNGDTLSREGQILFLKNTGKELTVLTGKKPTKLIKIEDSKVGVMFGHSLGAVDLNLDKFDDLIVGSPTMYDDNKKEYGAIHIYMGGDITTIRDENRKRTIIGAKEEGRFGSAIAVVDIDRDSKSEIIVSAPYEDSGVVYILFGHELNKVLCSQQLFKQIHLSKLKNTQRIERKEFKQFGYSLQRVADVDNNGCDEVAIGAPGSGVVVLLKCLPVVDVTLSTQLVGDKVVRVKANQFDVEVCVNITCEGDYNGQLTVTNEVFGYKSSIADPTYVIDFPLKDKHCKNITVKLDYEAPDTYTFTTKVELVDLKKLLESKEYDPKKAIISQYSETERTIKITRDCKEDDCNPKLSVRIAEWAGSYDINPQYTIGQSESEKIVFVVQNEGHDANEACLKVTFSDPVTATTSCQFSNYEYTCSLLPIKRNAQQNIVMELNMKGLTNLNDKLTVSYKLYDNCQAGNEPTTADVFSVKYMLPKDCIEVTGSGNSYNITEKEMMDASLTILGVNHLYLVTNKCTFSWIFEADVNTTSDLTIDTVTMKTISGDCMVDKTKLCVIEFKENCTSRVITRIEFSKNSLDQFDLGWKTVDIQSELSLLHAGETYVTSSVNTSVTFNKELTVGNNKGLIILISIIVALAVLLITSIILYKIGFFKRKQKERLNELRQSVRRRSIRLASQSRESQKRSNTSSNTEDNHGMDLNEGDDCAFEELPTN